MTGAWRSCVMELAWTRAGVRRQKRCIPYLFYAPMSAEPLPEIGGHLPDRRSLGPAWVHADQRIGFVETRAKQLIAVTAACLLPPVPARQLKVETGMPTM